MQHIITFSARNYVVNHDSILLFQGKRTWSYPKTDVMSVSSRVYFTTDGLTDHE